LRLKEEEEEEEGFSCVKQKRKKKVVGFFLVKSKILWNDIYSSRFYQSAQTANPLFSSDLESKNIFQIYINQIRLSMFLDLFSKLKTISVMR